MPSILLDAHLLLHPRIILTRDVSHHFIGSQSECISLGCRAGTHFKVELVLVVMPQP